MSSLINAHRNEPYATRLAYGEALVALGEQNSKIVVLDADLMGSTMTQAFARKFPDRFFQVGISEADMIGVAAGLAHAGFIPYASSFAIFLTGKTFDQIRQSVCYSNIPINLVATHAGLQAGPDGATHQGLEDVALMRAIPGMTVLAPADAVETKKAVLALSAYDKPAYLRLGRSPWPILYRPDMPFEIGRAEVLRSGDSIALIGYGQMVARCLEAADQLSEQGVEARVIATCTIEPLDTAAIEQAAAETGAIVVAEEHQLNGGLGEAVARHLASTIPVPMGFVAMPNSFGESGQVEELMRRYGLTAAHILETALTTLERKQKG